LLGYKGFLRQSWCTATYW